MHCIKLTIKERINPVLMRLKVKEIALICLVATHSHAEDFISKTEYAKMLYSNPRGIGCNKCHGEQGEGGIISSYVHKGKNMALEAPNITKVPKERFIESLGKPHKIMPTYFLTDQEVESLYYYVTNIAPFQKNTSKNTKDAKTPTKTKK